MVKIMTRYSFTVDEIYKVVREFSSGANAHPSGREAFFKDTFKAMVWETAVTDGFSSSGKYLDLKVVRCLKEYENKQSLEYSSLFFLIDLFDSRVEQAADRYLKAYENGESSSRV